MTSASPAFPMFGEFVKTQRALAQLSLRQASQLARISNPYLSQIEHGWVLPSVTVMKNLAEAFSLSAETMLIQAAAASGGELPIGVNSTEEAIQQDTRLSVDEKKALLLILESFTKHTNTPAPSTPKQRTATTSTAKKRTAKSKSSSTRAKSTKATSKGETS